MKIVDILKSVGTGLITSHPLGKLALKAISAVTGGEAPADLTGDVAISQIEKLPPEQRERLMAAEIEADVEHDKQHTKRFEAMTNTASWSWLRPFIVLQFSFVVSGTSVYFMYLLHMTIESAMEENAALSVGASIALAVTAVAGLWPVILGVQALPAAIIRSWFGFREQGKNRAAAAISGQSIPPLEGFLSGVKKLFRS